MSRWPSGRATDASTEASQAPKPPSVPPPDFGAMSPEEIEAKAQELGDGLRAARSEMDEAAVSLATARAGLVEAAGRGFEAAKAAQRKIAEAEERLRTAEAVVEAVENAHRPFAAEAHRLSQVRTSERFALAQAEKIAERSRIDEDLVAALAALADVTARRERATAEVLEIRRAAAQGGFTVPHAEVGYTAAQVDRAVRALGITLCRALAA